MKLHRSVFLSSILVTTIATLSLSGCGSSCESIQNEIQEISREIQQDPESAWDRAEELEELKNELEEMGCLG